MKLLWTVIVWGAFCLGLGAAFGGEAAPFPIIHLVRLNDPSGMDGFDLNCAAGSAPSDAPQCHLTPVKGSRAGDKVEIPFSRAKGLAETFLGRLPADRIRQTIDDKLVEAPLRDTLLAWKVAVGGRGTSGFFRRSARDTGVDAVVLRAVLLLESDLKQEDTP